LKPLDLKEPDRMILKQYGTSYQSVQPNFNSRALTEIGFRRDKELSISAGEFDATYERVGGREFSPESEGDVHDRAEEDLLRKLEDGVKEYVAGLGDGEILVVESREGEDYPKTRDRKKNVVVDGENRLYFYWRVDPPLRLGVYQKKS
jgi:hypothetical protein